MRTIEPTRLTIGERAEWTKSLPDYPATEYTMQYRIRYVGSGAGNGFDVNATASGENFLAVITAAQSTALTAIGRYKWQRWLTKISDATFKVKDNEGYIVVEPGFVSGTLTAVDGRSTARQILDALLATQNSVATATQLEYEISTPAGSRRVKNLSAQELINAIKYWTGVVNREDAAERMRLTGEFGRRVELTVYDNN